MAGTKPAAKKRPGTKPAAASPFVSPGCRELSDDAKVSIFREYAEWVADGRMHVDSPINKLMNQLPIYEFIIQLRMNFLMN